MRPKLNMSSGRGMLPLRKSGLKLLSLSVLSLFSIGCRSSEPTSKLIITGHGSDRPDAICQAFRLTAEQAAQFFQKARPITARQMHDDYEYLPCWVQGKTTGPQGISLWKIRPIGIAEVTLPNQTRTLLGCKNCDDLFR